MKKWIINGIAIIGCLGLILHVYNNNKPAKDIVIDAKVDEYTSLAEIEDKVTLIVKVNKLSDDSPMIRKNSSDRILFTGTIGNVEVLKVYKNTSDRTISVGDQLPILENETYNKVENVTYHIAGYKKMEQNKEYMLFLDYSVEDEWYVPCSAVWGKYPLDPEEETLFVNNTMRTSQEDENPIDKISKEVLEKY